MGGIPRVQMVFNLDPSSSTIHALFDLPPFTSFEPLALFTLVPHYGFWSFGDPATLTTTGVPYFISTLFSALFLPHRRTDQAAAPVGKPCERNLKPSSGQL